MKKQEHTLTLRISKDILHRLRRIAQDNYCSVSDVVRDIVSLNIESNDNEEEHVFQQISSWDRAVRARDNQQCVLCGSAEDIRAYLVTPVQQGGLYTLSNGTTLCFSCHYQQAYDQDHNGAQKHNGHMPVSVYDRLPHSWLKRYRQAKEKGKIFWERYLACFLTRRKRPISPIVEWYAETFLRDVPEEVIIHTLIELCPTPEIIDEFPSRRYSAADESFAPPPLIWNIRQVEQG